MARILSVSLPQVQELWEALCSRRAEVKSIKFPAAPPPPPRPPHHATLCCCRRTLLRSSPYSGQEVFSSSSLEHRGPLSFSFCCQPASPSLQARHGELQASGRAC